MTTTHVGSRPSEGRSSRAPVFHGWIDLLLAVSDLAVWTTGQRGMRAGSWLRLRGEVGLVPPVVDVRQGEAARW